MVVICNVYESVEDLLPHFYRHYSSRGVRWFLFGIHRGESNSCWNRVRELNTLGLQVEVVASYSGGIDGQKEGESLEALRLRVPPDQWYIPADLDEFHTFGELPFPEVVEACQWQGADYVASRLCDRISEDGRIPLRIDPEIPITEQFPRQADISGGILKACVDKVCVARQCVQVNSGHHHAVGPHKPLSSKGLTYHFKWFGDLYAKEQEKFESYRSKGFIYYAENQRMIEHLGLHGGRLI